MTNGAMLTLGLVLGIAIGYSWRTHQYAVGLKSEKDKAFEKWKHDHEVYQRMWVAWLKKHPDLNAGGNQ